MLKQRRFNARVLDRGLLAPPSGGSGGVVNIVTAPTKDPYVVTMAKDASQQQILEAQQALEAEHKERMRQHDENYEQKALDDRKQCEDELKQLQQTGMNELVNMGEEARNMVQQLQQQLQQEQKRYSDFEATAREFAAETAQRQNTLNVQISNLETEAMDAKTQLESERDDHKRQTDSVLAQAHKRITELLQAKAEAEAKCQELLQQKDGELTNLQAQLKDTAAEIFNLKHVEQKEPQNKELEDLQNKLQAATNEIDELKQKQKGQLASVQCGVEECKTAIKQLGESKTTECEAKLADVGAKLNACNDQLAKMQLDCKELDNIRTENNNLKAQIDPKNAEVADFKKQIDDRNNAYHELEKQYSELLETAKDDTTTYKKAIGDLKIRLATFEGAATAANVLDPVLKETQSCLNDLKQCSNRLNQLDQKSLDACKTDLAAANTQLGNCTSQLTACSNELVQLKDKCAAGTEPTIAALRSQLIERQTEIKEHEGELDTLKQTKAKLDRDMLGYKQHSAMWTLLLLIPHFSARVFSEQFGLSAQQIGLANAQVNQLINKFLEHNAGLLDAVWNAVDKQTAPLDKLEALARSSGVQMRDFFWFFETHFKSAFAMFKPELEKIETPDGSGWQVIEGIAKKLGSVFKSILQQYAVLSTAEQTRIDIIGRLEKELQEWEYEFWRAHGENLTELFSIFAVYCLTKGDATYLTKQYIKPDANKIAKLKTSTTFTVLNQLNMDVQQVNAELSKVYGGKDTLDLGGVQTFLDNVVRDVLNNDQARVIYNRNQEEQNEGNQIIKLASEFKIFLEKYEALQNQIQAAKDGQPPPESKVPEVPEVEMGRSLMITRTVRRTKRSSRV